MENKNGVIVIQEKTHLVLTKADGTQEKFLVSPNTSIGDINLNEYLEAGREFLTMHFETVEEGEDGVTVNTRDIKEARMLIGNLLNIEEGPDKIDTEAYYEKWVKELDLKALFNNDFTELAAYNLAEEVKYDKNEFFNRLNSFSSLKEFLESYSKKIKEIKKFSTKDLVEELIGRGGVETFHFDPQQIYVIGDRNSADHVGPATVLEVID